MDLHFILLHGALGAGKQLSGLEKILQSYGTVINHTFSGHGGKPIPLEGYKIAAFAEEVRTLMLPGKLYIVIGYSMGGYVATLLEATNPGSFAAIITLNTKWQWTKTFAEKEVMKLQPDNLEAKAPAFVESLKTLHAPNDWKEVVSQTVEMMIALGENPCLNERHLQQVQIPVLMFMGKDDRMVSAEELTWAVSGPSLATSHYLSGGHALESIDEAALITEIKKFMHFHGLGAVGV